MAWFNNLKIGKKLFVGFLVMILCAGLIGIVGIQNIKTIDDLDTQLYEENTLMLQEMGDITKYYLLQRVYIRGVVLHTDLGKRQSELDAYKLANKNLNKSMASFEKKIKNDTLHREFNHYQESGNQYEAITMKAVSLAMSGDVSQAWIILNSPEAGKVNSELNDSIEKINGILTSEAKQRSDGNTVTATKAVNIMIGLLTACILIAIGLAFLITKKITTSINGMKEAMGKAAQGDLTVRGIPNSRDEMGELTVAFNQLLEKIQVMTKEIQTTAINLKGSAGKVLATSDMVTVSSNDISKKTSVVNQDIEKIVIGANNAASTAGETSGNINIIAAAVEEMTATVRNMASASEETSVGVGQVSHVVEEIVGSINIVANSSKDVSGAVKSIVTAVKEINISLNEVSRSCETSINVTRDASQRASETKDIIEKLNGLSKQIGKIVNVINDIADQTNMLALNAAIEAAGAGEAGKGFAVVANEVKELAKQTAEATEEISQQIDEMQGNMTGAVQAVGRINQVIEEIGNISNTIAAAVTEQSATVGEISNSVVDAAGKVELITGEINVIAVNSNNASRSLDEASKGVKEIARSATELSTAVDEVAKNSTTAARRVDEVARNAGEISGSVTIVATNVSDISDLAVHSARQAVDSKGDANELAMLAETLDGLVKQFKL